ncbi:MAG TPA: tail fiber domain-containing protein [Pyrinomonadaceae bacterium]|nr:tail fiber domain-containing protein [Pyrinomonadaceae bacterium]
MFTNQGLTSGVQLAAGGGAWSTISDVNMKENFLPVNARDILRGVLNIPVSTWNYKSQDRSIRHIGVMAQDFRSTFNVGESDRMITTIDTDGVALAAIQGLNEELKDRDKKIAEQETKLTALEKQLQLQQQAIDALKAIVCAENPNAAVCARKPE